MCSLAASIALIATLFVFTGCRVDESGSDVQWAVSRQPIGSTWHYEWRPDSNPDGFIAEMLAHPVSSNGYGYYPPASTREPGFQVTAANGRPTLKAFPWGVQGIDPQGLAASSFVYMKLFFPMHASLDDQKKFKAGRRKFVAHLEISMINNVVPSHHPYVTLSIGCRQPPSYPDFGNFPGYATRTVRPSQKSDWDNQVVDLVFDDFNYGDCTGSLYLNVDAGADTLLISKLTWEMDRFGEDPS